MLYLETSKGFVEWTGQKIDGISHPLNIEDAWPEEDLAKLRLYKPVTPQVPEGKRIVGRTVGRENGVVTWIFQLEDAPPPEPEKAAVETEIASIKTQLDSIKTRLASVEAKVVVRAAGL